jgi:hypothetical protein
MTNARPKRLLTASGKLLDASNSAAPKSGDVEEVVEDNTDKAGWDGMAEDFVDDESFVNYNEDNVVRTVKRVHERVACYGRRCSCQC